MAHLNALSGVVSFTDRLHLLRDLYGSQKGEALDLPEKALVNWRLVYRRIRTHSPK